MALYSTGQRKQIILGCIAALGILLLYASKGIFTALLAAILLYTLFKPLFLYLVNKAKFKRALSAVIVILLSFLIIILPLFALSWLIVSRIMVFQKDPNTINEIIHRINEYAGSNFDKPNLVQNGLNNAAQWALGSFSSVLNGAFGTFITIMVMYFTLYFMLVSNVLFEHTLMKYLPFPEAHSLRFATELKNITYSNVLGQGLISLSQGATVGLGFLLFHIPDPLFWGVICVFVCFLPVVGAPMIFLPASIIELAYGNTFSGIGILLWGILVILVIDYYLRFAISRKIANTHPLITIIGVVIGVPVFGLLGLVIGPLLISYFILLVRMSETINTQQAAISSTEADQQDDLLDTDPFKKK
jgi:predicted PurR-regulated permease PerM